MLKNLWNKLVNKKVVDLDNDGKIESLRDEISGLFSQFKRMDDKLTVVNEKLETVVEEEIKVKTEAENRIELAKKEIENNKKLQSKVQDFIV